MTSTRPPAASAGRDALRYLELNLLWSDRGPVAEIRMQNISSLTRTEPVQVYARQGRERRLIGSGTIRIAAHSTEVGLIDLDRDFPSRGAWLHLDDTVPVQVFAGRDAAHLQITADIRG